MELEIGETVYWVDWIDGDPQLREGRVVDLSKIYLDKVGITAEYPGSYPRMISCH